MKDAANLAREFQSATILLNHAGMPIDRDENSLRMWRVCSVLQQI